MTITLERRNVDLFPGTGDADNEIRIGDDEHPNRFTGLIPYNSLSVDLGGFRERITPEAFAATLRDNGDVRALVDHDSSKLLGRTSNGTLKLTDTPTGLAVEIDLPDTSYARDARELVRRRDVRGLSFGFKTRPNGQRFAREQGVTIRSLVGVDLREVSVVGRPAYEDSAVTVRSADIDPTIFDEIKAAEKFPHHGMAKMANLKLRLRLIQC